MYRGKKIGVVVPAYNEESHIVAVLEGMPDFVDRVYVVDDASTDATNHIAKGYEDGRVVVIRHEANRGVGGAIVTGYRRCLADDVDIAAVMAGDNQMDPAELMRLLDPIVDGKADYAKGDRTSRREDLVDMSRWRRLGNWLLRLLTRVAVGNMWLMDPQNGYTAASRELLAVLPLARLYPRYGYCNQLLCWISTRGKRVVEVTMPARYLGEVSKIRYGTYVPKVSWLLLRLFLLRITGHLESSGTEAR
jgi:glycosyltransferase involved in cell wall biosynthesis